MKIAVACENLQEVRQEIDAIDQAIIRLLGQRYEYVQAAAKFKLSAQHVSAEERVKAMMSQRRKWAEESGISPEIVEKIYTELVQYFIQEEMKKWQQHAAS